MQQVSTDAEAVNKAKTHIETEKASLQDKCDRLQGEVIDYQARYPSCQPVSLN